MECKPKATQAMPRITKRTVKPTVEESTTAEESSAPAVMSDATITEAPQPSMDVESDCSTSSSASMALPLPSSKASSRRTSRRQTEEEVVAIAPEVQERIDYIHHLIDEGDEEMLERMLQLLQSYPYRLEEQINMIRSALAEMNRQVVAHEQHLWAEERAAIAAAEQAAREAAERAAMEAEERRLREYELAQLAELQAKYCKPKETSTFGRMCYALLGIASLATTAIALIPK